MELASEVKCLSCSWSDHLHDDTPMERISCPICGFNVIIIQRIPEIVAFRGTREEPSGLSMTRNR